MVCCADKPIAEMLLWNQDDQFSVYNKACNLDAKFPSKIILIIPQNSFFEMSLNCILVIENAQLRGALELSFRGDFRYTSPNAILKLFCPKMGGKVSQMTHKTDTSVTFHFCISILTQWKSKITINFMLILFLRFWGFQNCPWLSE